MYATPDDICAKYGADALVIADHDGDGQADDDAVLLALKAASSLMDGYIQSRYPLPLEDVPEVLKVICINLALYDLAAHGIGLSEEHRRRHDDAIESLKDISRGVIALVSSNNREGGDTAAPPSRPSPVMAGGAPKIFGRNQTAGF